MENENSHSGEHSVVGILCENRRQTAVKKLQKIIIIIIIIIIVVVTIFIVIITVTVTINSFIIIIVIIIIVVNIISNGNRTEWSPIRSVIIRVINKIGRPCSGSPICRPTNWTTRSSVTN